MKRSNDRCALSLDFAPDTFCNPMINQLLFAWLFQGLSISKLHEMSAVLVGRISIFVKGDRFYPTQDGYAKATSSIPRYLTPVTLMYVRLLHAAFMAALSRHRLMYYWNQINIVYMLEPTSC